MELGIIFIIVVIFIFLRKFGRRNRYKTYIDKNGYRRFTDTDKAVHRWMAEKKLGRKLRPGEVVHHKNRNKLDNSQDNLQVFANQGEHDKEHKESGWY